MDDETYSCLLPTVMSPVKGICLGFQGISKQGPNVVLTVEVMTTQIKQSRAIYSKLAISRKPTSTNWIWQRLKTVRRMVQLYCEKRKMLVMIWLETVGKGMLKWANWMWGIKCDRLGLHIWLSSVDLILEAVQKLGKLSVINQFLSILGWLLQELLFGFLSRLLEIVVWYPTSMTCTYYVSFLGWLL